MALWFYRTDAEWNAIAERLKLTPCPHCQAVGMLVRHGHLFGFDERNPRQKALRARRIFCSNRNARRGCGRTFSVWLADKIRRLGLTTGYLWKFLQHVVASTIAAATRAAKCHLSDRTLQRVWKRFDLAQSHIRTALLGHGPPPSRPAEPSRRPAAQVIAHLQATFPNADCPIADFQHALQTFFV